MNTQYLPAPRLELRWRQPTNAELREQTCDWICDYNLVVPLAEHDRRCPEKGPREFVTLLGQTASSGEHSPEYPPVGDGAHASWDRKHLGDLPVYLIQAGGESSRIEYE